MSFAINRRTFVGTAIAASGLAIAGCGTSKRGATNDAEASDSTKPEAQPSGRPKLAAMTVYRDPSCGCCEAWANLARTAGYEVTLIDHSDMPAVKRQYAVPEDLMSCHTAIIAGYAIEGHVPFADVERLLENRPADIKGIAVPGMPPGSPGMEMPDGARDQFQVIAFKADGKTTVFRA